MASDFRSRSFDLREEGSQDHNRREVAQDTAADPSLDLIQVSGRIKWFDVAKGFGFILPDNGMPDVLLHVTCLRRDGYQIANEGARIVVEAVQRPSGLQAFRVVSLDESTALHPSELPLPRTHVQVVATSGLEAATVKWFNRLRGFGFLTQGEDKPDIFVHMETLRRYGIMELKPGDQVFVRFGDGSKGLMAAEVRLADTALPAFPLNCILDDNRPFPAASCLRCRCRLAFLAFGAFAYAQTLEALSDRRARRPTA